MFIIINSILFQQVSIALIISASMVIISNHAIFSLLFLVLCFILVCYYDVEFKKVTLFRSFIKYWPAGCLIGLSFLTLMIIRDFSF